VTNATFLLDTNICIYVLRDADGPEAARLGQCFPGSVAASTVTLAEILRGIAPDDGALRSSVDALFGVVDLLPFDEGAARCYASIPFRRGTFDRLIAAQALARNLILVTNNERDFVDVDGLRVENWTRI
jgi:tRNA(fMet)-specific endonuclease VapC